MGQALYEVPIQSLELLLKKIILESMVKISMLKLTFNLTDVWSADMTTLDLENTIWKQL